MGLRARRRYLRSPWLIRLPFELAAPVTVIDFGPDAAGQKSNRATWLCDGRMAERRWIQSADANRDLILANMHI